MWSAIIHQTFAPRNLVFPGLQATKVYLVAGRIGRARDCGCPKPLPLPRLGVEHMLEFGLEPPGGAPLPPTWSSPQGYFLAAAILRPKTLVVVRLNKTRAFLNLPHVCD